MYYQEKGTKLPKQMGYSCQKYNIQDRCYPRQRRHFEKGYLCVYSSVVLDGKMVEWKWNG